MRYYSGFEFVLHVVRFNIQTWNLNGVQLYNSLVYDNYDNILNYDYLWLKYYTDS